MSDPAIEATQRAWHANSDNDGGDPQLGFDDRRVWDTAISAAHEMAKTVQELHRPVAYINRQRCCLTCWDNNGKPHLWPCETAKRVYPSEELGL